VAGSRSGKQRSRAGVPAVRFRVDFARGAAIGPGKIALLEEIDRVGSLSQAARALNMSYRRAWQLLESLNGSFAKAVVITAKGGRGGGGAILTPFGRELVRAYHGLDAQIQASAARAFRRLLAKARRTARPAPGARARTAPVRRLKDR